MKTTLATIATATYAALIAIGGIIGYVKAGSTPSLVAGLSFGFVIGFNSIGIYKGCRIALSVATILSLLLGAFFSYRFYLTQALMPAGLMIILSVIVFLIQLTGFCCNKESCKKD